MTGDALQRALDALPDCELRRCARKALDMRRGLDDVPARLRDIDLCVFRGFGVKDVPADLLDDDYESALALLDAVWALQAAVRRDLFARFGLRCITGTVGEPYDERSPRYTAAKARPTGDPGLDWHVADTAACGYEWNGTPAVLLPARVDVYRYEDEDDDEVVEVPEASLETRVLPAVEPEATPLLTIVLPDGSEQVFRGPLRLRLEEPGP